MYDLAIEGEHEFYANGILVHNCPICLEIEGRGWQPLGSLPRPGDPHPGDRCALEFRNSQSVKPTPAVQPARQPQPRRATIGTPPPGPPPRKPGAEAARARLTALALESLALAEELRNPVSLHQGPGPHASGSPQSVHAGGSNPAAKPPPEQMGFDFASPAPEPPAPKPRRGPDTRDITDRLIARYREQPEVDDGKKQPGGTMGWIAPDGRFIDISDSPKMHAEVAFEGLYGRSAESDEEMSAAKTRFEKIGFVRFVRRGRDIMISAIPPLTPAAQSRIEHIFDTSKPETWAFDLIAPSRELAPIRILDDERDAVERLRARTGIDLRGLYAEALARRWPKERHYA